MSYVFTQENIPWHVITCNRGLQCVGYMQTNTLEGRIRHFSRIFTDLVPFNGLLMKSLSTFICDFFDLVCYNKKKLYIKSMCSIAAFPFSAIRIMLLSSSRYIDVFGRYIHCKKKMSGLEHLGHWIIFYHQFDLWRVFCIKLPIDLKIPSGSKHLV